MYKGFRQWAPPMNYLVTCRADKETTNFIKLLSATSFLTQLLRDRSGLLSFLTSKAASLQILFPQIFYIPLPPDLQLAPTMLSVALQGFICFICIPPFPQGFPSVTLKAVLSSLLNCFMPFYVVLHYPSVLCGFTASVCLILMFLLFLLFYFVSSLEQVSGQWHISLSLSHTYTPPLDSNNILLHSARKSYSWRGQFRVGKPQKNFSTSSCFCTPNFSLPEQFFMAGGRGEEGCLDLVSQICVLYVVRLLASNHFHEVSPPETEASCPTYLAKPMVEE